MTTPSTDNSGGTILLGLPAGVVRGVAAVFFAAAIMFLLLALATGPGSAGGGVTAQEPGEAGPSGAPAPINNPPGLASAPTGREHQEAAPARQVAVAEVEQAHGPSGAAPTVAATQRAGIPTRDESRFAVLATAPAAEVAPPLAPGAWAMTISNPNGRPAISAAVRVSYSAGAVTVAADATYTVTTQDQNPHQIREQYEFVGQIHGDKFAGRSSHAVRTIDDGPEAVIRESPFDLTLDIAPTGRLATGAIKSATGLTNPVRMTAAGPAANAPAANAPAAGPSTAGVAEPAAAEPPAVETTQAAAHAAPENVPAAAAIPATRPAAGVTSSADNAGPSRSPAPPPDPPPPPPSRDGANTAFWVLFGVFLGLAMLLFGASFLRKPARVSAPNA